MIKIYIANIELLNDAEVFSRCFAGMHAMRKEKVLRCKQEKDKKRSLLAGILLKIALEEEGLFYEHLSFDVEAHGRPILKNVNYLHFSLSHAGDYALCCISDQLVGADMEVPGKAIFGEKKADRMHAMVQKILSESEKDKFFNANTEEKAALFLKYWTRKESYSKAMGEGLRMDFSKIDTECMEESFWSCWLEQDCFVSIYTMKQNCMEPKLQKITDLRIICK